MSEVQRKFLGTLWNTYAFFVLYADIDGFNPTEHRLSDCKLTVMDRWVLSELNSLVKTVDEGLDKYEITETARAIEEFTDKVSNWYVAQRAGALLGQRVDGGQEGGLRHAVHRPYDVCQACRAVCAVHYRKHLSESGAQL